MLAGRSAVFIALGLTAIGLLFLSDRWNAGPERSVLVAAAERSPASLPLPIAPPPPVVRSPSKPAPPRQQINRTPSAQINQARQRLVQLEQDLRTLDEQIKNQRQQDTVNLPARIAEIDMEIQNLSDLLHQQRLASGELKANAEDQRRLQASAAEALRGQIEESMRVVASQIQQAQAELVRMGNVLPLPEQRVRQEELRNLLTSQQQLLNGLASQRATIAPALNAQTQNISAALAAEQEEVVANMQTLQQQIFGLRNELVQMQTSRGESQMNANSLVQRMREVRQLYENQRRVVAEMEKAAQE